jgi:DNA-binding Lrp family transcriptional regulator
MGSSRTTAHAPDSMSASPAMDPILQLLQQNACMSRGDIANALNLSVEEVERRIKEYEQSGVILAYQAVVDTAKLYSEDVIAFIEVRITPERGGGFDRLAERIAKFDEVKNCWLMSGGYDLAVMVECKNLRAVARFVAEKLSTVEGVLSTATRFRLKNYKQDGVLLSRGEQVERLPVTP